VIGFAERIAAEVSPVPVRLVDERLSTVGALRKLRASGVDARAGRGVVDQAAAVIILQSALDEEHATGVAPGRLVPAAGPPSGEIGTGNTKAEG